MNKVALIIIYNHQFNSNIATLERIYKDRFANIFHLVPFYSGNKPNVIPVYECSYYFQGYVSQGLKSYFKEEYEHYFFVADDMVLNPIINEGNYKQHLKLEPETSFIPSLDSLHDLKSPEDWWMRTEDAYRWDISRKGVEATTQLPAYNEALEKFKKFGLSLQPLQFNQIWKTPRSFGDFKTMIKNDFFYYLRRFSSILNRKKYNLPYPIVGSYSDIFVVSGTTIKEFCHYCGVFAATELFVELAIPTALVLSSNDLRTENEIKLQGKCLWREAIQELDVYENSLHKLTAEFPINYLYLHPIKLSKWNTEL